MIRASAPYTSGWSSFVLLKMDCVRLARVGSLSTLHPGCARFPKILQNFSERQILWSLCSVVFHAFVIEIAYSNSTFCGA